MPPSSSSPPPCLISPDAAVPAPQLPPPESPSCHHGLLAVLHPWSERLEEMRLDDVTFRYPGRPEQRVLDGCSLTIAAGQSTALVGPSGGGKSTLQLLLARFYDPDGGAVALDGVDLKALRPKWLRASVVGVVTQEPVLFQGTVGENIAHGKPDASQSDIEEAAATANASGFIGSMLSDGFATVVGEKGAQLSGGQKQRIAIARAIIKKPAVLLLDEATSALDNESERIVQAALDALVASSRRTTLVIAHRLSTVRGADSIAVVSEGAVVEQGSHAALLAAGGRYAALVQQHDAHDADDRRD